PHSPADLPIWDSLRQMFWSSGIEFPDMDPKDYFQRFMIDWAELGAGEKATMSLQLNEGFVIVFEPVTHAAQFLDVKGEPTRDRQNVSIVFNKVRAPTGTMQLRPGPLRLSLENRANVRVLPGVWIAGETLHSLLGKRKPFLTAKRLLTNPTFRAVYGTETPDVHQHL